jgi:hypothetical protein
MNKEREFFRDFMRNALNFHIYMDREELAYRIGKPWHEIRPDVTYLEEEGYLVTEREEIRSRIFHILSITNEGVKFLEKPP